MNQWRKRRLQANLKSPRNRNSLWSPINLSPTIISNLRSLNYPNGNVHQHPRKQRNEFLVLSHPRLLKKWKRKSWDSHRLALKIAPCAEDHQVTKNKKERCKNDPAPHALLYLRLKRGKIRRQSKNAEVHLALLSRQSIIKRSKLRQFKEKIKTRKRNLRAKRRRRDRQVQRKVSLVIRNKRCKSACQALLGRLHLL